MSERLIRKLLRKGWKYHDIHRTLKIIEEGKEKKHKHIKILDVAVYWIALIVAVIGNIIILITLLPFLLMLKSWLYYIIIGIIGLSFGLLFEVLIRSIEHLEKKHHFLIGTLLPIIIFVKFILIIKVINVFLTSYNLSIEVPMSMGVFYATCFILPYFVYQISSRLSKYDIRHLKHAG